MKQPTATNGQQGLTEIEKKHDIVMVMNINDPTSCTQLDIHQRCQRKHGIYIDLVKKLKEMSVRKYRVPPGPIAL